MKKEIYTTQKVANDGITETFRSEIRKTRNCNISGNGSKRQYAAHNFFGV
jgi:hypothetical protein